MSAHPLSEQERAILSALADELIPPAAGSMSASQAGIAEALFEQAASYDPGLGERLRPALAAAADTAPAAALDALRQGDPEAYDSFCETVAAIYFMSPQVRAAVGFPGREAKPARIDVAELEELLTPVVEANFMPRSIEE